MNKSIRNIIYTLCYQNNKGNDEKKKKKKKRKKEAHSHKIHLRHTKKKKGERKLENIVFLYTHVLFSSFCVVAFFLVASIE